MSNQEVRTARHSNAYNLFIFALTIFSLVIMVAMLLPLDEDTYLLLWAYDTLICFIFLTDFIINLSASHPKSEYFVKERGWLDLLGSIPPFGAGFKFSGLFRLARLSRLARISRLLRDKEREEITRDILQNRSQYTAFITVLLLIIVLSSASVLVLQFESQSSEANITTGWDALWYSIVTITTVGYGDYHPVTTWGRITGIFVMIAGVGLIGVIASLLSGLLIGEGSEPEPVQAADEGSNAALEQEVAAINQKLDMVQEMLKNLQYADTTQDDR